MRYVDFKLNEASDLRVKELVKYLGTAGDRVPIFLNKLKSENPVFQTKAGQNIEIKVSQEEITRIEKVLSNPDAGGSLIINTEDGQQINTNTLAKTGEYGGVGANKEGERKIANRGNTMEGVLGAATVARLMKRPGDVISPEDVKRVIQKFPQANLKVKSNGKTVSFDASFGSNIIALVLPPTLFGPLSIQPLSKASPGTLPIDRIFCLNTLILSLNGLSFSGVGLPQ